MSLKIYNTMTREKEEFRSLEPNKIKMYVCGPTVYNYIHIGNARPLIFFDVVRRYLTSIGYEVNYVVNFTDIDDKLIRKAQEEQSTVPELAQKYIDAFLEDAQNLHVHRASLHPRVTENVQEIIEFIGKLVELDFAYPSGGDVYYRTNKFEDYGKLSHQNLDELQHGIRIQVDERKENPQDFVLWKGAKPGELAWETPWGPGRPGWHIECSAMVRKYLGDTIDIHGGGADLAFPHHECEVAQSEAVTGVKMSNYWMHNEFLNINNEKMSKSLGNGITVRELLRNVKPETFRYFMLSGHYRNPLNFSDDSIDQAQGSVDRMGNCIAGLKHRAKTAGDGPVDTVVLEGIQSVTDKFAAKMQDDFNTPDAITAMFDLVSIANQYLTKEIVTLSTLQALEAQFAAMDAVLGILPSADEELMDADIEKLIEERAEARRTKNWARADEIRDLLTELGIVLEDTPQGLRWRRK